MSTVNFLHSGAYLCTSHRPPTPSHTSPSTATLCRVWGTWADMQRRLTLSSSLVCCAPLVLACTTPKVPPSDAQGPSAQEPPGRLKGLCDCTQWVRKRRSLLGGSHVAPTVGRWQWRTSPAAPSQVCACGRGQRGALNCSGSSDIHAYHIYYTRVYCMLYIIYTYSYASPVCYASIILDFREDSCEACSSTGTEYGHCAALRSWGNEASSLLCGSKGSVCIHALWFHNTQSVHTYVCVLP